MLFPSQHLQAIIDAALAKRNFLAADIYEGAGTGEATDEAAAAIGQAMPLAERRAAQKRRAALAGIGRLFRFRASRRRRRSARSFPTYQMSFTLYENGVTNDLVMDYGDYALAGSLKQIEPLAERRLHLTLSAFPRGVLAVKVRPRARPSRAVAAADRVHGAFRPGALLRLLVDQVARLHQRRGAEIGDADPDQAEARRPSISFTKQLAAGAIDAVGEVGRAVEVDVARAQAEVAALQLEHDQPAGKRFAS